MVGSKTGLGFGAGGSGASAGVCGVSRPEGIIGSSLGSASVGALDRDLVVTGDVGISKGGGCCVAGAPAMGSGLSVQSSSVLVKLAHTRWRLVPPQDPWLLELQELPSEVDVVVVLQIHHAVVRQDHHTAHPLRHLQAVAG